jgi:hypothetical protein
MMGAMRRLMVFAAALAVAAGCQDAPVSPTPAPSSELGPAATDPGEGFLALALGPWRPAPIAIDQDAADTVANACRSAGGAPLAELPVAVVDARGEGLVTVVFADDHLAIECRTTLDATGQPIVEEPARLDPEAAGAIEEDQIRVVGFGPDDSEEPRSMVIGRVGAKAMNVKLTFDDESEVVASMANGWFATWWRGSAVPGAVVAVDSRSLAIKAVSVRDGYFDGRVDPATWWVDPDRPAPSAGSTVIPALIMEQRCASGRSPEGRIAEPEVFYAADAVLVSVWLRRQVGGQDCQGNPPFPIEINLSEPLGDRKLLDGSEVPPRDAKVPPG